MTFQRLSQVPLCILTQICTKFTDVAFIRTMRTCKQLKAKLEQSITKKNRVKTTASLPVFAYAFSYSTSFFDVPLNGRREVEDDVKQSDRFKESALIHDWDRMTDIELAEENRRRRSQVSIVASGRRLYCYKGMRDTDLSDILRLFEFDTVSVELCAKITGMPRYYFVNDILRLLSIIRAKRLILQFEPEDLKQVLGPRSNSTVYNPFDESLMDLFDLYKEILCNNETPSNNDVYTIIKKTIVKNIKGQQFHDQLNCTTFFKNFTPRDYGAKLLFTFRNGLETPVYFYYVRPKTWNRYGYALLTIYEFHDDDADFTYTNITNCDGCHCGMDFCFTKMIETIIEILGKPAPVTDFGPILEQWDRQNIDSLAPLVHEHFLDKF